MKHASPRIKIFALIGTIISTIAIALVIVFSVYGFNNRSKDDFAISDTKVKGVIDLDNKIPESNLLFDYDSVNGTATFKGLASFDKTAYKTLEIPSTVMYDDGNGEKPYTVTAVKNIVYTQNEYAPHGYTQTHDANGNPKTTYYSSIFYYGSFLTALVIPDTVTEIEEGAFYGLASIEYLKTPFVGTGIASKKPIGAMFSVGYYNEVTDANYIYPFMCANDGINASTANHVNVTYEMNWYEKTMSSTYFYHIPVNLKTVVITKETSIGTRAFVAIPSIEQIVLPDTLTSVGDYAFSELSSLTSINLPNSLTSISVGLMAECTSIETIILPNNVTGIPNNAFGGCSSLELLYIPSSITKIGDEAFEKCTDLADIKVFYNGQSATNIVPSSDNISFPSGLSEVGKYAFKNCESITLLRLSNNVTSIGEGAFGGMSNLAKLYIPFVGKEQGNDGYQATIGYLFGEVDNGDTYQATQCNSPCRIPSSLREIQVTNETIISTDAFKGLSNQANIAKGVTTIVINSGVTYIENKAFDGCASLVSITLPFTGVYTRGSISGTNNNKDNRYFSYIFGKTPMNGLEIDDENDGTGRYIPVSLRNITITNQPIFYTGTFTCLKYITSVEIYPNATTEIGEALFYKNDALQSLTLPFVGWIRGDWYRSYTWWYTLTRRNQFSWVFSEKEHGNTYADNTIRYYNSYIRYIPNQLTHITVTDEDYIGPYSFKNLTSVTHLTIGNINNKSGLTIAKGSCSGMNSLTNLTVPFIGQAYNSGGDAGASHSLGWIFGNDGNDTYHYKAYEYETFYVPRTLSKVNVETISKVPNYSLANLTSVSTIEFNSVVTEVGSYSFYNDTSLSKIDYKAGSDFTKVGDYAFYNNVKLNYLKDAVPLYSSDSPATNQSVYGLVFGASAFGKTAISSIDFTKIKKAGEACFEGCFKLFSIEVTSNVEVANYLFRNCIYLTSINLAPGKATVGMFEGCTALVNADVAAGTTYEDLQENITKYYIPDRLFKGCSQLIWGGIGSSSNGGLIINSQITTIGESAFEGCTRLTTFTIPDKVVEIKDRALYGVNKINIILIPTSVQKIGANVFTQDIGHDFGIWVHEPKEKWPKGWTTGWNCVNPVYVIPGIDDSMYEFEFSSELLGYVITGIKSALQGTLTGRVNLPRLHNYVDVVGVDKDVFKYENVDQIVVPSSIKYFGDNALSSGKRTDVYFELLNKNKGNLYYIEKDPSQNNIYVKQKTNNVDKKVTSDWKNLIPVGYVFFGDYWQYGSGEADEANTPYLKASELYFEIESEFTYNAQAWTPEVSYIETKAEVVRNKNIEDLTNELDADLFNYVYKNNVYAGTATVYATINNINYNQYILEDKSFRIAGSAEFNFEILQAPIKIWYTNTKEDHIFEASKTYDEKTYSESNFGNHNVVDLLENCVFTGRIETTSADAGTYEIDGLPSNEDFIWAQAYKVTRKGQDVTRNFIPLVYMRVVINPLVVNLDWTDCNKVKDQYDILDYLEYQYTGQVLVPTAAAFKLDGTPVPHCIVETFEYNTLAKYPDTDPSLPISKYDAKARIAESSRNNYVINNPVSLENQYIEAKYTIVKREVTICLNDSHYLIPYNDKSFIWNNWDWNNPEGSTLSLSIEGLQNGSKLVGTVVTVANEYHIGDHDSDPSTPDAPMANKKDTYTTENGSVDWKDTTVVLANYLGENDDSNKSYENSTQPVLPWFIYNYVNGKIDIENKYYNVTLDSSITIAYNEFIIDYVVDGEVLTLGNKITIDGNDQYPAEYEADGNVHQVYPVIKNEGIAEGDYKVNYGVGTFTNDIPTVQELGFYTIGINVSRKNFEQEYKIIRLECIKSNVKYDLSILNKEYDGEPVPTFDKYGMSGNVKFITKKALDTDLTEGYEDDSLNGLKQEFTFEYCDLNKNVISAPTIPGTYYIHIQAPQTHYFNAINKYQVFTISKRVIDIYVDHVDLLDPTSDLREPIVYDGSPITFTIDTTAGGARGKLLGEAMDINGLDTRHQLKGTFVTRSQYPGTYSAENEDDFIWTTNWNVYSLQLGNIRTYYDVKLHGSVKIAQKTIKYTVSEPYNGPFDGIPHGLTITVEDPNPAQASVLFTTVEANATNDGPNSDIEWSPVCPKYTEPGSYQIWFKIVAGLIPNTDGETTYKTEYGTKTINITALVFEYTKPTELVVDQSTNPETPYYIEYDGEEHELEIIVTNHPTPIIHYRLYKGTDLIYDGYNVPKVVEKGTYTLTAKIEADFYQTIEFEELEYQFRVTDEYLEELPSVVCQDVIETFTGNAYSIEVIVSGLANDKVVNIKYEADNSGSWSVQNPTFTNVGSHTIRYLVHVKGYQVKVGEAQVIITPASFTGLITAQGYNGPYTATAHKPVITGIPLNATNAVIYYTDNHDVTYLPLTANGWFTDVDQFAYTNAMNAKTIYFTITADNYEDYTDSVDIKIDKVQLAPTFTNGKEIEYSGKPLTVSQLEIDTIHDGYPNIKYYNATVDGSNNYTYLETDLISAPTQLGTYYFKLEYADTDNCYPAQVEGGFKIVPRTVTVNYTQEVEYNGKERGPNPTVITGTDDVLYIVATRKDGITSLPIEIGEYDFTFAFSTNQVNYKLPDNCKEITFKITQIHLLVEFTDQKDYKDDEVWTRTSNWNEFSFTNKLLKDHEFHSVMETSNYAHGTYVYSTDNQTVSSYVVNIYNTYITDADGNDVTNLYDIKYDIVVKIVYPPISFNLIEYDEPYDGYAHGLEFSFGPNIDTTKITIYYCEEENYDAEDPAWSQTKPTRTGVGSDKIYFRMISSIYETVEGYGIVKVTPAYLDINIFDYSEVYDAADHYVSFEVTNVYGIDNSIAIKDYYPVEYVDFEELTDLYQDFNEDNPYYSLYEDYRLAAMKDAGHYYAVVRFEEAQNWIESYAIKEVEVQQRGIHFDLLSSKPMIETNYNGTKYGQNKPYILIGDALYNPSELIPTHNMLYATKYGSTQYNLANKNYSVRTVSANAGYYYGTYYVDMFGNTYNTHGFEFNNMKILDANKKDVTKNYYPIFDDNDLIVKINRIALPKFDVTSPDSKEYDGQAPTPTVDTPSDGVITYKYYEYINGVFINTELDSVNATEVGKYKVYVSIANGTNYYAWPTEEISEYEILPRNVDVIWEDEEVTFNGQKQEPKAYFINAFNEKQYVDVYMFNVDNYYEQILKAGSYEAYVKDDPTLYNYKLNNTNVLFVINKYQQDIVVDGDTNVTDSLWTYYFDENDITTLSDLSITNSAQNGKASISTISSAGGYYEGNDKFTKDVCVLTSTNEDVTDSILFNIIGTVRIITHEITYSIDDEIKIKFDNHYHSVDTYLNVTNPRKSDAVITYSWTSDYHGSSEDNDSSFIDTYGKPQFKDVDTYYVTFNIHCDGYDDDVQGTTTIVIYNKDSFINYTGEKSITYSGNEITKTYLLQYLTGEWNYESDKDELVITFFEYGQTEPMENNPIDAGVYEVVITVKDDDVSLGYTILNESFVIEITPRILALNIKPSILITNEDETLDDLNWTYNNGTFDETNGILDITGVDVTNVTYEVENAATDVLLFEIDGSNSYLNRGVHNITNLALSSVEVFDGSNYSYNTSTTLEFDQYGLEALGFVWNVRSATKKDTDTGKYIDVTKNYGINLTITVNIHLPYLKVNIPDKTFDYNGQPHSTTIEIVEPANADLSLVKEYYAASQTDLSIKYAGGDSNATSISTVQFTNPGTWPTYYLIDYPNYEPATGSFNIKINKDVRNIVFNDQSLHKTYDGKPAGTKNVNTPYYLPTYTYDSSTTATGLPDFTNFADNIQVTYRKENASLWTSEAIDQGNYQYKVIIPESDNYQETEYIGSFTIDRRPIYISGLYQTGYTGSHVYYNNFASTNSYYHFYMQDLDTNVMKDITISKYKIVATITPNSIAQGQYDGNEIEFYATNGNSYYVYYDNVDVTRNYELAFEGHPEVNPATFIIQPGDMTVNIDNTIATYDGSKHHFDVHVTFPENNVNTTISYSEDNINWSTNIPEYTERGERIIHVKITNPNFNEKNIDVTFTINPKQTVIEFDIPNRYYNGEYVQIPTNITTNYPPEHENLNTFQYSFYQKEYTSATTWQYKSISPSNPVDAGEYMLEIIDNQPSDSNYSGGVFTDEFEIKKVDADIIWDKTNYIYNGQVQKPTAQVLNKAALDNIVITYKIDKILGGDKDSKNAGSYNITATLSYVGSLKDPLMNYNFSDEALTHFVCSYEILQREVTVMLNQTRKYNNGAIYSFGYNQLDANNNMIGYTVSSQTSSSGLVTGHTFAGSTLKSNTGDLGQRLSIADFNWTSGNGATYAIVDSDSGEDVTANYAVSSDVYLGVDHADLETAHINYKGKYDGQYHTATPQSLNLVDVTFSYSMEQNGTYVSTIYTFKDVGDYTFWIKTEAEGYNERTDEVSVKIEKKDVALDFADPFASLTKDYDGNAVVNPEMTYADKDKQTLNFTYTYYRATYDAQGNVIKDANGNIVYDTTESINNPSSVGYYRLDIAIVNLSNNYANATASKEFRIKKIDLTIQFSDLVPTNKDSVTYDGHLWKKSLTDSKLETLGLVSGEVIEGSIQTKSEKVGEYKYSSDFEFADYFKIKNGGATTTSNYNIIIKLDVEITKAKIIYDAHDNTVDYDGANHNIIVNVTVPDSDYIIEYSLDDVVYKTNISLKNTGTYNVHFNIKADNYESEHGVQVLKINGIKTPANVDYASKYEYTGQPYSTDAQSKITINTLSNGAQTITFYKEDGTTKLDNPPTIPGTYKFKIHVDEYEGYDAIDPSPYTFTITPKKVNLIWENTSFVYDGLDHIPTKAYFIGVVNNVYLATIDQADKKSNAGTHVVHAEITHPYYTIGNTTTEFTIGQQEVEIPEIATDMVFTYKFEGDYLDENNELQHYEFGDNIVVKDVNGNIYEIDSEGVILSITEINDPTDNNDDVTKVVGVDIDELPYRIILDEDKNADGVKSSETNPHKLQIVLISNNYCWKDLSDDKKNENVIVPYSIKPYDFSDGTTKLGVEYVDDYYQIYDGVEKYPEIKVVIKNSQNINIKELLISATEPLYPEYEITGYDNNTDKTTKDNPALIYIKGRNNFSFGMTAKFEIVSQPPTLLTLKSDATVQFIEATVIDDKITIVEDGTTVRSIASQQDVYLGHLHQSFTKTYILNQFSNYNASEENIKIFGYSTGEAVEVTNNSDTIGTNFEIRLYDTGGEVIDTIRTICYGDLDGNGVINLADVSVGADIFMNGLKYDDLGIYYISALINRNLFAPNLETLSSQADYFMNGDVDDFNKNFLVKIN